MPSELTQTQPHTSTPGAHAHTARAYAASSPTAALQPFSIERRGVGPKDVKIQILYCGVCHSDLHQVRNEWQTTMPTQYPCVPGHEIVGRVEAVGRDVTRFREGDFAGVGCMVGSCETCQSCRAGLEQYCEQFPTLTYNSTDPHTGGVTYGGYSESIVVDEAFTLRISKQLDLAATAPLLCAGITTYSPLRRWNVGKGQKVGVVGLGGLGHMGVKFAHAFGARVVLFTTSEGKREDGIRLGADEVVVSKNADEMAKHVDSFDFILDTVSAAHDVNAYIALLGLNGTLTMVGAPEEPLPVSTIGLLFKRRSFAGSIIGGIRETQEMLDFCAEHGITADIERIRIQELNDAFVRLARSDVKYRFVIDMATLEIAA
ncbi:MAG: NAD(P)-dependent alcohol dehydrogenase [Vicinamibacterales bacterium]